jgi:hypothetical protein
MTNTSGTLWESNAINMGDDQLFTIASLRSTNNIPSNISLSPSSIDENSAAASIIGTLSTTDLDITDTHTYTLVPGVGDEDNIYFSISGDNQSIIHSPDYEIRDSYSIRIQTDD